MIPPVKFLHPIRAHERACDVGQDSQASFTHPDVDLPRMMIRVYADLADDELEALYATRKVRQMFWEAHYWGRPDRLHERELALLRGIVAGQDDAALVPLLRSLWDRAGAAAGD